MPITHTTSKIKSNILLISRKVQCIDIILNQLHLLTMICITLSILNSIQSISKITINTYFLTMLSSNKLAYQYETVIMEKRNIIIIKEKIILLFSSYITLIDIILNKIHIEIKKCIFNKKATFSILLLHTLFKITALNQMNINKITSIYYNNRTFFSYKDYFHTIHLIFYPLS